MALTAIPQRVYFDPKNKKHLDSLKAFLQTGQWGEVKFQCEAPFLSVPEYVLRKFAASKLGVDDVTATRADLLRVS